MIAGESWSDHAECVSPMLGSFLRSWNDSLDDGTRQKLKPYAAKVIGTAGDGHDEWRAWLCVDWLARTQLPVWLDLAGLGEHAAAVRALIAISTPESARVAKPTLDAARYAAWASTGYAAGDAAWAAGGAAAGAAAWYAAGAAGGYAAWAAAGAAAGVATGDATWGAARAVAWVSTRAAAWGAAGVATGDALKTSVIALQMSAFELLDRMIEGPK